MTDDDDTRNSMNERARHPVVEAIYCAFALLMLVIPGVATFLPSASGDASAARERRGAREAPRPEWDRIGAFPAEYQAWFGRNFGLREPLLRAHARLCYHAFRRAPGSRVILGKDDWLFTTASGVIDDVRGVAPLEPDVLESWRLTLEARRDYLASRGIHFVFALVPSKSAVYPELLPDRFEIVGQSRRQRFLDYLHEHSDVDVLDLMPALLEAKAASTPGDDAYYPLGTHWTDRGAYHGYRAILEAMSAEFAELRPWPLSEFEPRPMRVLDDESPSVFLEDVLAQQESRLEPVRGRLSTPRGKDDPNGKGLFFDHQDRNLPRALLIRDSFGVALAPFLAQHFSTLQSIGSDSFPVWAVDELRPQVVIQVYVDRYLHEARPSVQTLFDQSEIEERFDASDRIEVASSAPEHPRLVGYRRTRVSGGGSEPAILHLDSLTHGFMVEGPAQLDADEAAVLRIAFAAPEAALASVYYMEQESQGYRHQRCERLPVRAGSNELYFLLSSPTITGPLLVRPGTALGDYRILDYEVRVIGRAGRDDQ